MVTEPPRRRLVIPLDDRELTVAVEDDTAVLDLAPTPDAAHGPERPATPARLAGVSLRVPARALVAALRVAWADAHDLRCFEPWRDLTAESRWRGHEPYEDRYGGYGTFDGDGSGPSRWYDDLGDGDPDGFRDPTVVPFPRRPSPFPEFPRPARSGQPWEPEEEAELRDLWLAASPEADRDEVVRQVAEALERGVGGIAARLPVVGCDRARPGRRRDDPPDEEPEELLRLDGPDDGPDHVPAVLPLRPAGAGPWGCGGTRPR